MFISEVIDISPGYLDFNLCFIQPSISHDCGSVGKESACSAGDLGSILVWEDRLEKEKATHFSILAWRTPWTIVHEVAKSQT